MVWKNKKPYLETNEDVDDVLICYRLDRLSFTNIGSGTPNYDYKYKRCLNGSIISGNIVEDSLINPQECIILNSLKVNNININLLASDVQNAIDNNSGEISIPITDTTVSPNILLGQFSFVFSECPDIENDYNLYIKNQSIGGIISLYITMFTAVLVASPPLGPGQEDFGYAGILNNTQIEIWLTNVYSGNVLKVYINELLTQTINVYGSGTYIITGISKLEDDILEIILE